MFSGRISLKRILSVVILVFGVALFVLVIGEANCSGSIGVCSPERPFCEFGLSCIDYGNDTHRCSQPICLQVNAVVGRLTAFYQNMAETVKQSWQEAQRGRR